MFYMPIMLYPMNMVIAQHPITESDKHWLIAYYVVFALLLSVFVIYKKLRK